MPLGNFILKHYQWALEHVQDVLLFPFWGILVRLWEGSFESLSSGESTGQIQVLQMEKHQEGSKDS